MARQDDGDSCLHSQGTPHRWHRADTILPRVLTCPYMSECAHTGLLQRPGAPGHAMGVWV